MDSFTLPPFYCQGNPSPIAGDWDVMLGTRGGMDVSGETISLHPGGNCNPKPPAHSLVTLSTELSWFVFRSELCEQQFTYGHQITVVCPVVGRTGNFRVPLMEKLQSRVYMGDAVAAGGLQKHAWYILSKKV